jgi:hypothetical protein
MSAFAERAIAFFSRLSISVPLPKDVAAMNPYQDNETMRLVEAFFKKFYGDDSERVFLWGINPGRFGGGATGISFTDPFALKHHLGIDHHLAGKRELSSQFVYEAIEAFGGAKIFYSKFYINSLSPIGFTRRGKNFNFYDDAAFLKSIAPFLSACIQSQINFGANRERAICLGTGKLYDIFSKLNRERGFFKTIVPIEHPRFIMQYRRKEKARFIEKYRRTLEASLLS